MRPRLYPLFSTMPYAWSILSRMQHLQSLRGGPVVIQGSYNNRNIGDNAIGIGIATELHKRGIRSHLRGYENYYNKNLDNFRKYDYHIIGGGGILRDFPERSLGNRLMPIGSTRKGSIAMSLGFDGIVTDEGRRLIKKIEKCRFITVRDEWSRENLQPFIDAEIEISACPAFLTESGRISQRVSEEMTIGINLRHFYTDDPGWGNYAYYPEKVDILYLKRQYYDYLKDILKPNLRKLSKEYNIYFIPFAKNDIDFAQKYLHDIDLRIRPLRPPQATLETVMKMGNMICMRYHSIVFSILAGKNPFIISYHNKTRELSRKIPDATMVDFLEFEPIEIEFSRQNKGISALKDEMRDSAMKNFDYFVDILRSENQ